MEIKKEEEKMKTLEVYNPYNRHLIEKVPVTDKESINKIIETAARHKIADIDIVERAEILAKIGETLHRHRYEFMLLLVTEGGKPFVDAEHEVAAAVKRLFLARQELHYMRGHYIPGEQAPGSPFQFAFVTRKPLGTVLVITPFNYPLFIPIAKIVPALVAGNSIICKPSSETPLSTIRFVELANQLLDTPGALSVIVGGGSEVGDFLVSHPGIDGISFTGSTEIGKRIVKMAGIKKLQLELGGKSPALVLEDADLDLAARECVTGAMKGGGQRCDALSRCLVVESVLDKFTKKAIEEVKKWPFGDPFLRTTRIGPLINRKAIEHVHYLVTDAVARGAEVVLGGHRLDPFYEPTILTQVTKSMDIAWKEIFGPILVIIPVKDATEAIQLANQSEYGLDASVFTKDLERGIQIAHQLQCGSVTINRHPQHGFGIVPYGGDRQSGLGREGLGWSVTEMSKLRTVVVS